jgi:hypothetical protein
MLLRIVVIISFAPLKIAIMTRAVIIGTIFTAYMPDNSTCSQMGVSFPLIIVFDLRLMVISIVLHTNS